jgi:4-methylaminobutanoate oxidase (formaldehyde-forming)
VFDQLTEEGKKFGMKLAGAYAMDNLRLEKGYRHWSHEMDSETTPLEARLMHTVDFKKVEYQGLAM